MKSASIRGAILLTMTCVGCSTSSSGGFILFPLPYKELDETKALKAAHSNPVVWPRELAKNVTGPAVAEPGDLLSIAAVDPAMRMPFVGEQPVLLDGSIDLAKYGRAIVGYKTLTEVEAIVNGQLKTNGGKDLAVTVRFARAPESKRVYVLGDVVTPGSYPINGNETVLDAILLAGGLSHKADERNIILSRPTPVCDCRVVVPVCHEEIVQWGDTSTNYQLLPGDRIYVPTLSLWCRMFGRKGPRCAPCNGCPSPCPLPEEKCGAGCCKPEYSVGRDHSVGVAPVDASAPAGSHNPAPPPPMAPKLEDRRLPPPQTLRAPGDATAIPTKRFPAGMDFQPSRIVSESSESAWSAPTSKAMSFPATAKPSAATKPAAMMEPAAAMEPAKDSASPPTDWQSPWRPASARTTP